MITKKIFEKQKAKYEESRKKLNELIAGEIESLYDEIEKNKGVLTIYRDLIEENLSVGNNELLFKDISRAAFAVRGPILHFNKDFNTIVYFDIEEDAILVNTFNEDGSVRDEMATIADEELIKTVGLKELLDNLYLNANLFDTLADENIELSKKIEDMSI